MWLSLEEVLPITTIYRKKLNELRNDEWDDEAEKWSTVYWHLIQQNLHFTCSTQTSCRHHIRWLMDQGINRRHFSTIRRFCFKHLLQERCARTCFCWIILLWWNLLHLSITLFYQIYSIHKKIQRNRDTIMEKSQRSTDFLQKQWLQTVQDRVD